MLGLSPHKSVNGRRVFPGRQAYKVHALTLAIVPLNLSLPEIEMPYQGDEELELCTCSQCIVHEVVGLDGVKRRGAYQRKRTIKSHRIDDASRSIPPQRTSPEPELRAQKVRAIPPPP